MVVMLIMFRPETTSLETFNAPPLTTPPVNPHQEQLFNQYEAMIDSLMRERDIPGLAIAVVRTGEVIYIKGFGNKRNHANDPINIHTKFRIASASKGFSSILTGLLVQEGALRWSDQISLHLEDFLPEPKSYSDSLTVSAILSQTSGFPYQAYSNLVEDGLSLEELVISLSEIKLSAPPGQLYSYQNVAYSLIEPIMYKTTGKDYETLLRERIFEPLQMTDASANFFDMNSSPNAAVPHRRTQYSYSPIPLSPSYYNVAAAGGINASISDMSLWLQALLGYRPQVIPQEVLNEVYSPTIQTPLMNGYYRQWLEARRAYYGLGWRIVPTPTDTIIYHGGYANGFKSHVSLNPSKDIGIVILSNSSDNLVNEAAPIFHALFKDYEDLINFWDTSVETANLP
jgi:beta-lactamase class C